MSLEDDLAALEASDPTVGEAARRSDDTTASILSTSAQLRQTQAALAASQQDLSRTRATVVELLGILDAFQVASGADRQAALATGIEACYLTRAELASARQELDELRAQSGWIVARDGGRYCGRCWDEIQRGEAYEPLPSDEFRHIHCPNLEG